MADKTESEKFYGCLNSAGRIVLILIAGAVMLFVVVVLVGTCGCTSTAITGDAAVEIPAEETYSADAEYVPDVVAEPTPEPEPEPDAPPPTCGDCMAMSCSDCLTWCPDVGCVPVDDMNCGECGAACADGETCEVTVGEEGCEFACVS